MASSPNLRSGYRFPITVEVMNDGRKGHVPWRIATEFRLLIRRNPTIRTTNGNVFEVQFLMNMNEGLFTIGWTSFVATYNLEACQKIILKYYGDLYFQFNEKDQEGFGTIPSRTKRIKTDEDQNQFDTKEVFDHLRLTAYSTTKNHQNLPSSFVQACLSKKNVNMCCWRLRTVEFGIWDFMHQNQGQIQLNSL